MPAQPYIISHKYQFSVIKPFYPMISIKSSSNVIPDAKSDAALTASQSMIPVARFSTIARNCNSNPIRSAGTAKMPRSIIKKVHIAHFPFSAETDFLAHNLLCGLFIVVPQPHLFQNIAAFKGNQIVTLRPLHFLAFSLSPAQPVQYSDYISSIIIPYLARYVKSISKR